MLLIDQYSNLQKNREDRKITNWVLGDDRIFVRDVLLDDPLDSITDAYLTLKTDPTTDDSTAIIQKHVTSSDTTSGKIVGTEITINIGAADISTCDATTLYHFDIEIITALGHTITLEVGTISFVQDVTRISTAGTPAVLPNGGVPRFLGYVNVAPTIGTFNVGDWYRNLTPSSGGPSGFVCIESPCTWRTDGLVGDTDGSN